MRMATKFRRPIARRHRSFRRGKVHLIRMGNTQKSFKQTTETSTSTTKWWSASRRQTSCRKSWLRFQLRICLRAMIIRWMWGVLSIRRQGNSSLNWNRRFGICSNLWISMRRASILRACLRERICLWRSISWSAILLSKHQCLGVVCMISHQTYHESAIAIRGATCPNWKPRYLKAIQTSEIT